MQRYERAMLYCGYILVLACIFFIIELNKDVDKLIELQGLREEFNAEVVEALNKHTEAIKTNQEYIFLHYKD